MVLDEKIQSANVRAVGVASLACEVQLGGDGVGFSFVSACPAGCDVSRYNTIPLETGKLVARAGTKRLGLGGPNDEFAVDSSSERRTSQGQQRRGRGEE